MADKLPQILGTTPAHSQLPSPVAVLRVSTPILPSEEESRFKVKQQEGLISNHRPPPRLSLYLESCLAVVIADVLVGTTEKQDARAALLLGGTSHQSHWAAGKGGPGHGGDTRGVQGARITHTQAHTSSVHT